MGSLWLIRVRTTTSVEFCRVAPISSVINKTIKTSETAAVSHLLSAFENSQHQHRYGETEVVRRKVKQMSPVRTFLRHMRTPSRMEMLEDLWTQPLLEEFLSRLLFKLCRFQWMEMEITTRTSSKPSMMAWSLSLILCFTMLWPCFCLPFCVDSLQNVKHKCPSCKVVLGRYRETC